MVIIFRCGKLHDSMAVAAAALLSALVLGAPPARAATITVNTVNQEINGDGFCSLQEAIYAANLDDNIAPDAANPGQFFDTACPGGSGHDVIEMPHMGVFTFTQPIDDWDNFIGPTVTPIITTDITIEGRGSKLERLGAGSLTRAFAVGPTGFLDLREVHIKGFSIHGGNGGSAGGGGGMGAGGAIYVQGGELLVQWTTFESNRVHGGNGGNDNVGGGGGGGGGLSGNGGNADFSGGGGGGSRGNGGNGFDTTDSGFGGGGGGRVTSAAGNAPGQPCGAAGGDIGIVDSEDGGSAATTCLGGGGGAGTSETDFIPFPGDGGSGSYGAGGGGGGWGTFATGDGGNGGRLPNGGGFGGGGGGSPDNQGGHGGFGGGGGQGFEVFSSGNGQGGTFAGDGGDRAGGGGAGLGGAIFGYLADIHIINSTFYGNQAERGESGIACGVESCGKAANDGRGAGGAIFTVAGDLRIESSTFSDNSTITVTNGGGGAIVVYDPEGDDEATLVLRNTIIANNGTSECYTRNGVTTSGSAGNIITNSALNNLDNPACPGAIGSDAQGLGPDPGLGPLTRAPTERVPTMAIGPTSPAINVAVGTVGVNIPLDDQRGVLRPQGLAADIGAYEFEIPEPVPPVTTIALTPSTPNGSNDWYKTSVGVAITSSDLDDPVIQTRCVLDPTEVPGSFADLPDAPCSLTSVGANGQHAIYAASVDAAGHESALESVSLKIDAAAPTLAPSLNVAVVTIGQTGVVASPNATDGVSGVASQSCGTVDTSTPGARSVTCTATDNAGNTASAMLHYVVEYRIIGFFPPGPSSKWRAGQTVPVKVALGNGAGTRISDAEGAALATACRVTFSATGAQSQTAQCMKYDAATDQFIYNWKLGRNPLGAATIKVSISYAGTSHKTEQSLMIVIVR